MNLHTAPHLEQNGSPVERIDVQPVHAPRKSNEPLYEKRKKIFPKKAEGQFRRFKWLVMLITLGIYYLTPWIRWDRGPFAPDQAVLVDLAGRRFYFFFIEIWPQEFFFVAGLLVMAGFGLFLVTSAVGRAWCGYACPQTVWVDLFLAVEHVIEGDRNARIKLDAAPWSFDKLWKRVAKHSIWLLIAVATGGAWIFYFADAPSLAFDFVTGHAAMVAYSTVATLTATTYVLGGLMREQVCIYMCPWPRIQGAMLDEHSLVVTYNDWRGEPRGRHAKKAASTGQPVGDCVDCNACVAVCPMGIDIRDGQQLACITCALCIDACDSVMDKIGKPRGLIAYATLEEYEHNMAIATSGGTMATDPDKVRNADGSFIDTMQHFDWKIILRFRTLLYFGVWALMGLGLVYALLSRDRLEVNVLHDRNPQFVLESDGSIRNGFTVRLLNMIPEPRTILLSMEGLPEATMKITGVTDLPGRLFAIQVEPDRTLALKVFVTLPKDAISAEATDFHFIAEDRSSHEKDSHPAVFNRPAPESELNMTHIDTDQTKSFTFTGWHMLGVMVLFFGTIISVNFYMAYNAVHSWSGLVAENTYVASQQFNGKAAEARALTASGVTGQLTMHGSDIRYEIRHPKDGLVEADTLVLKFKRPVGEHQDFELDLMPISKGVFGTTHQVLPGHWIVDASAMKEGKRILHQAERVAILRGQE